VRHCPSYAGESGRWYFNALAELVTVLDRAPLHARLRAIEAQLGRRRDVPGEVAIDIDLLASDAGDGWQADRHALAKGDLDHPVTQALLQLAGVDAVRR
jgi:7,8-dihydro-6-hydroxymethylpterin-pyrophosphokinase